ncbi:DUF4817 domain-containing protein [Trichonephila clavipes]|nr:DUF4817 domain-containing protein [Trichonephila clavipes]
MRQVGVKVWTAIGPISNPVSISKFLNCKFLGTYYSNVSRSVVINHYNSIFTAEALAICQALDDLVEFNVNLLVLSDSLSVLSALQNYPTKSHKKSPETLEMRKKAYGNDPSARRVLPVSMAENKIEGYDPLQIRKCLQNTQSNETRGYLLSVVSCDPDELWFQQDGATCHTVRATIDLLKDTFGDRLISRFGPVNWPPRSCDLTPLDYFLWGYVKSLVYADKPQTLDHLEDNVHRVIADMRPQMLEKVIENWTSRLDYIRASRGSPMPEIIFTM